jgi:hypothetical protein
MASRLRRRIAACGSNMDRASAHLAAVTPHTPMEMPMSAYGYGRVQAYPWGGSQMLAYTDLQPLWTADGAVIPAAWDGGWGWVKPAGRP